MTNTLSKNPKNLSEKTGKISDENGNFFYQTDNLIHFIKNQNAMLIKNSQQLSPAEWAIKTLEQQKIEEFQQKKRDILKEKLGKTEEEILVRPHFSTIDIDDEKSIFRFTALQNMVCAFGCCGNDADARRVSEICDILAESTDIKNIHFVLYPDPNWKQIKQDNPEKALQYFEVYNRQSPQNSDEKGKIFEEFRSIYFSL